MSGDAREARKGMGAIIYVRCGASANKIRVGRWHLHALLNYIKDVLGLYAKSKMLKVCRTIVLPKVAT